MSLNNDIFKQACSLRDKYMEIKLEYENLLKQIGPNVILESLVSFFEENKEVLGVGWIQFTPYFNDGDPCEFSVHDYSIIDQEGLDNYAKYYLENGEPYSIENLFGRYLEEAESPNWRKHREDDSFKSFRLFWCDDNLLYSLFGDHVSILVYRNSETGEIELNISEFIHD